VGLFWQIVVFLIVAAALGFAIGWVVRGARLEHERPATAPRQSGAEAALEDERDRLRTELQAAREATAELEAARAERQSLADARGDRVRELEAAAASSRQRIAELEDGLGKARAAEGDREAERQGAPPAEPRPPTDPTPLGSPADVIAAAPPAEPPAPAEPGPAAPPAGVLAGAPPQGLAAAEGDPDDLQQISGIGPGIEKVLHELGIYHFWQIAQFTPDNVTWVNQRLRFKGRIEREDWINQARRLAAGETAEQA
jgi:predicted flap endonuclease-1-like 5' DNA nuclease